MGYLNHCVLYIWNQHSKMYINNTSVKNKFKGIRKKIKVTSNFSLAAYHVSQKTVEKYLHKVFKERNDHSWILSGKNIFQKCWWNRDVFRHIKTERIQHRQIYTASNVKECRLGRTKIMPWITLHQIPAIKLFLFINTSVCISKDKDLKQSSVIIA